MATIASIPSNSYQYSQVDPGNGSNNQYQDPGNYQQPNLGNIENGGVGPVPANSATNATNSYGPRPYQPTIQNNNNTASFQSPRDAAYWTADNGMGAMGGFSNTSYSRFISRCKRNPVVIGIAIFLFFFLILGHHQQQHTTSMNNSKDPNVPISTSNSEIANSKGVPGEKHDDTGTNAIPADTHTSSISSNTDDDRVHSGNESNSPADEQIKSVGGAGNQKVSSNGAEDVHNHPNIAYLLSYPMSGTTYFMNLIRAATNTNIATNYEYVSFKPNDTIENGYVSPFWTVDPSKYQTPQQTILIETHCAGHCLYPCTPVEFIQVQHTFDQGCRTILARDNTFSSKSDSTQHIGNDKYLEYVYDNNNIDRLVHVMRDPFDNVVGRFHEVRRHHSDDTKWLAFHPNTPQGFKAWCTDMDSNTTMAALEEDSFLITSMTKKDMMGVPCRDEFFKYFQWHNLAVGMGLLNNYESLEIYYEYLETNKYRKEYADLIADFLSMETQENWTVPKFNGINKYRSWYSDDEIKSVTKLMENLAYPILQELLTPYFVSQPDEMI